MSVCAIIVFVHGTLFPFQKFKRHRIIVFRSTWWCIKPWWASNVRHRLQSSHTTAVSFRLFARTRVEDFVSSLLGALWSALWMNVLAIRFFCGGCDLFAVIGCILSCIRSILQAESGKITQDENHSFGMRPSLGTPCRLLWCCFVIEDKKLLNGRKKAKYLCRKNQMVHIETTKSSMQIAVALSMTSSHPNQEDHQLTNSEPFLH